MEPILYFRFDSDMIHIYIINCFNSIGTPNLRQLKFDSSISSMGTPNLIPSKQWDQNKK